MKRELVISGMTCLDCSRHVTKALEHVSGVRCAAVDYRGGRATVELDQSVAPSVLADAVARVGYRVEREGDAPSVAGEPPGRTHQRADGVVGGTPAGTADFDLLVIGTGGAGMAAAIQAVGMGGKVAIVEAGTLGGTCVNVGCIPSKDLIEAAAHYHAARKGFPGIAPCEPTVNWAAIVRHKDDLVGELRQAKYVDVLASYPGIAILEGRARFVGGDDGAPLRVRVGDGDDAREHRTRKVVIATGTQPSAPPISGLDAANALTSTTAMEMDTLPASLIVLGGSAVGLELGQMFARFGVKVTVVELAPRLLANEDEAISEALRGYLEDEGIEIHTGMQTTRVEHDGEGVVVHVSQGTLTGELRAERLLVAAGRRPNTRDMGLDDAGVALTASGFVRVDATMQTSNPDVYAAGDVTGGPGYVYVAAAGGRIAAENAMKSLAPMRTPNDDPREFDLSVVPNVTFTSPQVGSVGFTEAGARARGFHVEVSMLKMDQVPRALVSHDARGLVKVVSESASGKLLGIHAIAPNAGEFMGEVALAVRFGLTARDVASTLHPYLTWIESVKLASQGFEMDVSKLSCCA